MFKKLFVITFFCATFCLLNAMNFERKRFHTFGQEESEERDNKSFNEEKSFKKKHDESFLENDPFFDKLKDDSLIKQTCKGRKSYDCDKLRSFFYCAANKPSKEKFKKAADAIKKNKATTRDISSYTLYNHCECHDNDWEYNNHSSFNYHSRNILDEKKITGKAIIDEQAYILGVALNLQKQCIAKEQ